MQFKRGVSVYGVNNDKVGEIDRVVIDPHNASVTHIVVRKGFLFTEDKVIAVDQISRSTDDAVYVNFDQDRVDELPDYTETNYLPADPNDVEGPITSTQTGYASPVYWYPAVGATALGTGYWGMYPAYDQAAAANYRTVEEKNIPEGTVALKEGAKVLGKDGKHVGDVEKVLTENTKDTITHLVVSKGLFGQSKKLIPAHWVKRIREDAVQLSVGENMIDRLREYKE